ncbi:MAG TPA: NAD-binding protein [Burkholderiales bacterium]|nr:NAD-binding protein [Burkholderiales bacterium]
MPSALSAPFSLAGKRLRNRVVHASMSTLMAREGSVTDAQIRYYENRARGGAALIVTEPHGMADEPSQHAPHKTRAWNDDNLDGLKRWAEAVEGQDCRLLAQVQHPGRARHHAGLHPDAVAPSALPCDLSWTMPREMTRDEIRRFADGVAQSCRRLKQCGFSGVEISAGHGHLFHQFMSPWSNVRTDEYGGDWEGRTRIVAELVAAIRASCGKDFIVGLKLPGDDGIPGSIGPAEAAIIARLLTASGEVDFACFAQGAHARSLEMHLPDRFGPRMPYRALIARLRSSLGGVPLIALGRITDPAEAEAVLANGEAELIGLGRALVADPAWLRKAEAGRTNDIRYCVSCNSCWDTIITRNQPIACVNNPRVAARDEVDWWPGPAAARRRLVVVGAGVAGLEAAWVAAARGHEVTVFGRSGEVGGKARTRSLLPGGEEIASVYDYQFSAAQRAGVRFELGVSAREGDVLSLRPDAVILATGGRMLPPPWVPKDAVESGLVQDLRDAVAGAAARRARQTGTAVIFDMDHTEGTYAAAEFFHGLFERVVIVTPRNSIADLASLVARQGIERRLSQKGIDVLFLAEPRWGAEIEEGRLDCVNVYSGKRTLIDNVSMLTYSSPRAAEDALARPLRKFVEDVRLIGDCRSPRDLLGATADGHAAGNGI